MLRYRTHDLTVFLRPLSLPRLTEEAEGSLPSAGLVSFHHRDLFSGLTDVRPDIHGTTRTRGDHGTWTERGSAQSTPPFHEEGGNRQERHGGGTSLNETGCR